MKISDPIMKTFTFGELASKAENHLVHLVSTSKNKEELITKLATFYSGLVEILKADESARQDDIQESTTAMEEKLDALNSGE